MQGHHHTLIKEFPEYSDQIHSLKGESAHFRNLVERWEEIDKQIARSESRIELMSEEQEEQLRRSRLSLKDEIYKMLAASA
jgi:uncharacterized protein YdcH (DUF465 family)